MNILLFMDRFSWRADMFTVTAVGFTAEGTADVLVNRYITCWGCPKSLMSDHGLQFCSKPSVAVYDLLAMTNIVVSSDPPNGNGDIQRVNHTAV